MKFVVLPNYLFPFYIDLLNSVWSLVIIIIYLIRLELQVRISPSNALVLIIDLLHDPMSGRVVVRVIDLFLFLECY